MLYSVTSGENMRQKDNQSYVEKQIKLFENEECTKKASKPKDDQVPCLPPSSTFPPFLRSFSTSSAVDISAANNLTMDVLDIKTMLLKMKRLLEQVIYIHEP